MLQGDEAADVLALLRDDAERCYAHYASMLNEERTAPIPPRQGLARELARMNLTLNTYTQWYWKTNLHNLVPLPVAARRRARPVRNPRLCRRHAAMVEAWVPARRRRHSGIIGWAR